MNQIPNIEEEYTSHEALKEWEEEKDQNNLTQNIVALLGIHGMHCKFYEYQNASHITKAFEDLFHHQLQKARQDWLQEEIVKLEGILSNKQYADISPFDHAEVVRVEALQTILDRYNSELDQDNK
jgi:hypothetical protein